MTANSHREAFSMALLKLSMKCQGELTTEHIRAYWEDLSSFPIADVERAARALGRQKGRIYFPSVGEFIEMLEGSTSGNAELAWMEIISAARSGAVYSTEDRRAKQALKSLGGQRAVGLTDNRELPFLQKRFVAAYQAVDELIERRRDHELRHEAFQLPDLRAGR